MKKKILGSLTVIAIVAMTVLNMNLNAEKNEFSALTMDNVEASADSETVYNSSNTHILREWFWRYLC